MSRRPVLLDLFCGAGGAAVGYHRSGFDVVGVDVKPQPNYPFRFIQADAVQFLHDMELFRLIGYGSAHHDRRRFDAIHAAPPCQSFTAYRRKGHRVGDGYPNHIVTTRTLLSQIGLPYVIENVPGAPLHNPIQLCGSSFGLDVRRHRLFESNLPLSAPPCDHSWQTPRFPPATNRSNLRSTVEVGVWRIPLDVQQRAMGVDWDCTLRELSEMVPAYTRSIGMQLINHIAAERAA